MFGTHILTSGVAALSWIRNNFECKIHEGITDFDDAAWIALDQLVF